MNASTAILRSAALRAIEATDVDHVLMERAGAAGAALAEKICKLRGRPILIVAGPGNNGGDALVVARRLHQRSFACHLVLFADEAKLPADARKAWQKFLSAGGTVHPQIPAHQDWDLVIDGLFGLGLSRDITGHYAQVIEKMQAAARHSNCPLLALDCPSGLDSDTGTRHGSAITASHTITFLGLKPGLLTADGPDSCGVVTVAELDAKIPPSSPTIGHLVERGDFKPLLQARRRNTNKGSYGAAGILGGAPGMVGAALLAGRAALKLGCGRVYLGFPADAPLTVDPAQPELMLRGAATFFDAPLTALACGPGLGQEHSACAVLAQALDRAMPLVLDADALNLLASHPELAERTATRSAITVLTPHPGEAARLLGCAVEAVQADRLATAHQLATRYQAWVVLKGCGSVIVSPDQAWWINTSGNPGLASAGTGDTLCGMLVALLAQGYDAQTAVLGAVHLHGAAADVIAAERGAVGLTASELADAARSLFNQWIAAAV